MELVGDTRDNRSNDSLMLQAVVKFSLLGAEDSVGVEGGKGNHPNSYQVQGGLRKICISTFVLHKHNIYLEAPIPRRCSSLGR